MFPGLKYTLYLLVLIDHLPFLSLHVHGSTAAVQPVQDDKKLRSADLKINYTYFWLVHFRNLFPISHPFPLILHIFICDKVTYPFAFICGYFLIGHWFLFRCSFATFRKKQKVKFTFPASRFKCFKFLYRLKHWKCFILRFIVEKIIYFQITRLYNKQNEPQSTSNT